MKHIEYEIRYASHPDDVKKYDTQKLREHFLVSNLFEQDKIKIVYTEYDRFIVGGAFPVDNELSLDPIDPLKADYFLERRELGIINVGGPATISVDGEEYSLEYKEALYVGRGVKSVIFKSVDKSNPAKLYFNSANAHTTYPTKKVTLKDAVSVELGTLEQSNARIINKLIVNDVIPTCQLQMGLTEFKPGSVWNTMPAHTHSRRMETYFYFEIEEGQTLCHFMGKADETRHIFLKNNEAVISPTWSLHAGVGTSKYAFIWGMAGENLDYGDMDIIQPHELR